MRRRCTTGRDTSVSVSWRGERERRTNAQLTPKMSPTVNPDLNANSLATHTPRMAEMVLPAITQRWEWSVWSGEPRRGEGKRERGRRTG